MYLISPCFAVLITGTFSKQTTRAIVNGVNSNELFNNHSGFSCELPWIFTIVSVRIIVANEQSKDVKETFDGRFSGHYVKSSVDKCEGISMRTVTGSVFVFGPKNYVSGFLEVESVVERVSYRMFDVDNRLVHIMALARKTTPLVRFPICRDENEVVLRAFSTDVHTFPRVCLSESHASSQDSSSVHTSSACSSIQLNPDSPLFPLLYSLEIYLDIGSNGVLDGSSKDGFDEGKLVVVEQQVQVALEGVLVFPVLICIDFISGVVSNVSKAYDWRQSSDSWTFA
ncbi:hypothetical protein Tco_0600275 [Tanacetum coccineum]|uniref:Uncharacterized protein n=1 Tax=Tanacetum coccineum TaxID=301880 RepID=A0ABQ4WB83_9ASTR